MILFIAGAYVGGGDGDPWSIVTISRREKGPGHERSSCRRASEQADATVSRCAGDGSEVGTNARRTRLPRLLDIPPDDCQGRLHPHGRWSVLYGRGCSTPVCEAEATADARLPCRRSYPVVFGLADMPLMMGLSLTCCPCWRRKPNQSTASSSRMNTRRWCDVTKLLVRRYRLPLRSEHWLCRTQ